MHMPNIDSLFAAPDFQISVSGGSAEENAQMATAIGHAMSICGFTQTTIAPTCNVAPDFASFEVINSLRALNPDLFESCVQVGAAPQELPVAMPLPAYDARGNAWYQF